MFKLFSVAFAAALVASVAAQLQINTPTNVVECEPTLLSWSGGTGPYFLSIQNGNDPTGPALINFGQQTGTSFTWTVNVTSGTSLGLAIRDTTGTTANSAAFTVNSGSSSCIGSTGSSSSGSSSSGSSTSGSSTSGAPSSTSSGATTTGGSSTGTSTGSASKGSSTSPSGTSSSTSSSSSSTSSSGAKENFIPVGVAAVLGAAVAAIMA